MTIISAPSEPILIIFLFKLESHELKSSDITFWKAYYFLYFNIPISIHFDSYVIIFFLFFIHWDDNKDLTFPIFRYWMQNNTKNANWSVKYSKQNN